MSMLNLNALTAGAAIPAISKEQATQLATALAQIIQNAPDSQDKKNFIRDLAEKVGIETVPGKYDETHELKEYNPAEHECIQQRGKLIFIDDRRWEESDADLIFNGEAEEYRSGDFEDVANDNCIGVDDALENVNATIKFLTAVKTSLETAKANGGEVVTFNNDDDFDYDYADEDGNHRN